MKIFFIHDLFMIQNEEEEGQNGSPDIQATAEVVQAVNE